MKKVIIFTLLIAFYSSVSWAQCGYGVDAGGGNCVPGAGIPGSPFNHDNNDAPPPAPRAVWADRWGAFAFGVDGDRGVLGTSRNRGSSSEAEQAAIQYCSHDGGENCKIIFTYHNQCAAYAQEIGGTGRGTSAGAINVEQAIQNAKNECSSYTGHVCEIIYSKCSYPERIQ